MKNIVKVIFWIVFILVLLRFMIWFILGGPSDYQRSKLCGPSESITKPIAEAIVREINKRGTPNKIVKLDSLKNLPYVLVECEKEVLIPKGKQFQSKQTCYFKSNGKSYKIKLEQPDIRKKSMKMTLGRFIYMYISKNNEGEVDFTEIFYSTTRWKIVSGESIYSDNWDINYKDIHYSKKSKGTCRYKRPIRF
jgi:hypothetical protein